MQMEIIIIQAKYSRPSANVIDIFFWNVKLTEIHVVEVTKQFFFVTEILHNVILFM